MKCGIIARPPDQKPEFRFRGSESKFGLADAVFKLQLGQLCSQEFHFSKVTRPNSRLVDADNLCKSIEVFAREIEIVSGLEDVDECVLDVENKQTDRVLQLRPNDLFVVFSNRDAIVSLAAAFQDEVGPDSVLRRAGHVGAVEFGSQQGQVVAAEAQHGVRPESSRDDPGLSDAEVVPFCNEIEITCDRFIDGFVQGQALRRLGRADERETEYEKNQAVQINDV